MTGLNTHCDKRGEENDPNTPKKQGGRNLNFTKMKKLIYGGLFLALGGIIFVGCKKENVATINTNDENSVNFQKQVGVAGQLEEKKRSYVWVNDKLDCSQDGSGCIVSSIYHTENGEIDLSVIQVLTLIELRNANLNQYFTNNDLSYEFPSLYESDVRLKIASGELRLTFEFPYLKLSTNQGSLERVFNYETTLSDKNVLAALQGAGNYTKKASLNTDPGTPAVWKCTEDGDNCKVSSIKYNAEWLADNPEFLFAPTTENIESSQVVHDGTVKRVIVRTVSGKHFGIEF